MSTAEGEQPHLQESESIPETPKSAGDDDDGDGDDDIDDQEFEEEEGDDDERQQQQPPSPEAQMRAHRAKLQHLFQRMATERVNLRVHDVIIRGNNKTKDSVIEPEVDVFRKATSMQELLQAAGIATARLQRLEIFDSVNITLDSGPPELPGTANVVVEVIETKSPLAGNIGLYTKAEAGSSTIEGSIKYKNLFGYGDLWDGSLAYGWDRTSELCAGVSLPRFKRLSTPLSARVSLLSHDWMKFSSCKEQSLGLSLGLFSTRHHDLAYSLAWRMLTDPTQMSSRSVRRQLGHSLLSSLKYTFKVDKRDSPMRPTRGYALVSSTQIGGLAPDHRNLRFLRQEFDLRFAVPFGFFNAALNLGISGGIVFPWGSGFLNKASPLPERFFLGGNSSPVCTLGGPALPGFKTRGVGPTEPRRYTSGESAEGNSDTIGRDYLGGDLAVSAFADLSFDLPLNWLREKGIHGHVFACAGNLAKLTENEFKNFSSRKFFESSRSCVGAGIIIPTGLFRMEVNYCYTLKQLGHDKGKTGLQFNFSFPFVNS